MNKSLSLVMITKNCGDLIEDALISTKGLIAEIIIVDDYSIDKTVEIAKKYGAKIYLKRDDNFGRKKSLGVKNASNDWILILDSDERISQSLKTEIKKILNQEKTCSGYSIPFQNYFLGKVIRHGGENYKKLILFNKRFTIIKPALVHEKAEVIKGDTGSLKNVVYHYSYRSLLQTYKKFTNYALKDAVQKKQRGEGTSFKKIVLYPVHMFWTRFFEDKGYKDGFFRVPLDVGFTYMEFLTYFSMLFLKKKK